MVVSELIWWAVFLFWLCGKLGACVGLISTQNILLLIFKPETWLKDAKSQERIYGALYLSFVEFNISLR